MAYNFYHILNKLPYLNKLEMPEGLENMAYRLVMSGRLRVNAEHRVNFVRLYIAEYSLNIVLSYRELTDEILSKRTMEFLNKLYSKYYSGQQLTSKINNILNYLNKEFNKFYKVDYELEMKLARIIVQSAHPAIIEMLLQERVEIFVSYNYNIENLVDISTWQQAGENSGMQMNDGYKAAIFVSTGGDPFSEIEDLTLQYGDGFPALARMMVILGQEIGHYSDIMRDDEARQISRYSADFAASYAKEPVRSGRIKDLERIDKIYSLLKNKGLLKLKEADEAEKFFKKQKKYNHSFWLNKIKRFWYRCKVQRTCRMRKLNFITMFNNHRYLGINLWMLFEDMKFNLNPDAEVYRFKDYRKEEAIKCVEALARVPQQVIKWGPTATKYLMKNLYSFYYNEVILGCMKTAEILSYKKFYVKNYYHASSKILFYRYLFAIKRIFYKDHLERYLSNLKKL